MSANGVGSFFKGRIAALGTQHNKELVMSPYFSQYLGVDLVVPAGMNTDCFGTFSGELKREESVIEVLRSKCDQAMALAKVDMGIASEGSFGPHPAAFFAYADEEWVMVRDKKNDWEFVERVISLSTNFDAAYCDGPIGIEQFARKIKFPEHALIARCEQHDFRMMKKGIQDWDTLMQIGSSIIASFGRVYLETDMRAMYNPTRMKVISEATEKLMKRISSLCPDCHQPGFGVTKSVEGLPCKLCNRPTQSTLKYVKSCAHCGYDEDALYPHHKLYEEPMYCDHCNP